MILKSKLHYESSLIRNLYDVNNFTVGLDLDRYIIPLL